eukprot:Hpha_TRINITY_DN15255_c0_g2::TRINITY_DN15255_c0_g2_i1::g.66109::m.66109
MSMHAVLVLSVVFWKTAATPLPSAPPPPPPTPNPHPPTHSPTPHTPTQSPAPPTQSPTLRNGCGRGGRTCTTLYEGENLYTGEALESRTLVTNLSLKLVMQGDGNLVLYIGTPHPKNAPWATGTHAKRVGGLPAARAIMQKDGNLVLYTAKGKPIWATGTNGHGTRPYRLELEATDASAALVLYDGSDEVIWRWPTPIATLSGSWALVPLVIFFVCVLCFCTLCCRTFIRAHSRMPPQPPQFNDVLLAGAGPPPVEVELNADVEYHNQGREETWLGEHEHPSNSKEAASCAICMEALWRARVGVLTNNAGRVCRHLMHYRCAIAAMQGDDKLCPLCRAKGSEVVRVPRPAEDPLEWFRLMDVNGEFALTKQEVIDALRAQMDVDEDVLSDAVTHAWDGWTAAGGQGVIRAAELPLLLDFLRDDRFSSARSAPDTPPPGDGPSPLTPPVRSDFKQGV